jgi:MFS family permease
LPLWLKQLGLPILEIGLLTSLQSITHLFTPYAWGALSDHTGERVRLLRLSAVVSLLAFFMAQALHALTFASHHTACLAMLTHHFPSRLRARDQTLFSVVGNGLGGCWASGLAQRWCHGWGTRPCLVWPLAWHCWERHALSEYTSWSGMRLRSHITRGVKQCEQCASGDADAWVS